MPMASRLAVRVEVRDCAVCESSDREVHAHRNSGSICDKITSHRRPSDLLGQFLKKKKKMEKFRNFRTGLSRYYWGYF